MKRSWESEEFCLRDGFRECRYDEQIITLCDVRVRNAK